MLVIIHWEKILPIIINSVLILVLDMHLITNAYPNTDYVVLKLV